MVISIKGQMLRQYLDTLRAIYGEEAYLEILHTFESIEFRDLLLRETLLASAWYPIELANQILVASVKTLPAIHDLPELVGKEAMARDLRGIYGYVASILSPDLCLRYTPRLIQTFNRGIRLEGERIGPGHARLHFTNTAEINELLFRAMKGGTTAVFERVGARELEIHIIEGGKLGDPATVFELRWAVS